MDYKRVLCKEVVVITTYMITICIFIRIDFKTLMEVFSGKLVDYSNLIVFFLVLVFVIMKKDNI